MAELKNARVWYDPNTGRLQVTVPGNPLSQDMGIGPKHVTLRFEYSSGSSIETSISAYPRRRDGND